MVGRRQVHGFDQVFAVSTTGFTHGARDIAGRQNIKLRTVEAIQDIANDFKIAGVIVGAQNVRSVDSVTLIGGPSGREMKHVSDDRVQVRALGQREFRPFGTLVAERLAHAEAPGSLSAPPAARTQVQTINIREPFMELRIDSTVHPIDGFVAEVTIEDSTSTAEALTARTYAEDESVIAQEGLFHFETPWGPCTLRIDVARLSDGMEGLVLEVLEEPDEMRPGSISVWGRNRDGDV